MITLIQNADVYAPRHLGMRDVLLEGGKIALIAPCGRSPLAFPRCKRSYSAREMVTISSVLLVCISLFSMRKLYHMEER